MSTPRIAYSLKGSDWENRELLEELLQEPHQDNSWYVASWQEPKRGKGSLMLLARVPQEQMSQGGTDEFLNTVGHQLNGALQRFCQERGWPEPRFELQADVSETGEWSYEVHAPETPVGHGQLKPNKLLAVGEPEGLGRFLGLETVEPVFGLSAKWIARSQMDQALQSDLTVFDAPGVIAAHVLHQIGDTFHNLLGFWELQRWIRPALPEAEALIAPLILKHSGLVLRLVRDLILDGLWLPEPAKFFEALAMCLPELEAADGPDPAILGELVRKEIVPLNLPRWVNERAQLEAVEWKGSPTMDQAEQTRLLIRLAAALTKLQESRSGAGVPVVMCDFEQRRELAHSLKGIFPQLPIISWPELPTHAKVEICAVVDADLAVDPTPWPTTEVEVSA